LENIEYDGILSNQQSLGLHVTRFALHVKLNQLTLIADCMILAISFLLCYALLFNK